MLAVSRKNQNRLILLDLKRGQLEGIKLVQALLIQKTKLTHRVLRESLHQLRLIMSIWQSRTLQLTLSRQLKVKLMLYGPNEWLWQ
jgi:hypothetical protein